MGGRRRRAWKNLTPKEKIIYATVAYLALSFLAAFFCFGFILFGIIFITLAIKSNNYVQELAPVVENWNNKEKAKFETSFPESSLTVQWKLESQPVQSSSLFLQELKSEYSSKFTGIDWESYYFKTLKISPTVPSKDARIAFTIVQNGNVYSQTTKFIDLVINNNEYNSNRFCFLSSLSILIPKDGDIDNKELEIRDIISNYDCDYDWEDLDQKLFIYVKSANDPEVYIGELAKNGIVAPTIKVNGETQNLTVETAFIFTAVFFAGAALSVGFIVIGFIVIVVIWVIFTKFMANVEKSEKDSMNNLSQFNSQPQMNQQMVTTNPQQQGVSNFQPVPQNQEINWLPIPKGMQQPNGMQQNIQGNVY